MSKAKALFLQKHDKYLFGKDFIDNVAETIKAEKKSIEAKTEVSRLNKLTDRPLFQRGSLLQNKVKYKCNTTKPSMQMVNIFSLRGIDLFHKKSSFSSLTLLSMEVLTNVHPFRKDLFAKSTVSVFPQARRLKKYISVWKMLAADQSVLYSVNEGHVPPKNPNIRARIKRK